MNIGFAGSDNFSLKILSGLTEIIADGSLSISLVLTIPAKNRGRGFQGEGEAPGHWGEVRKGEDGGRVPRPGQRPRHLALRPALLTMTMTVMMDARWVEMIHLT